MTVNKSTLSHLKELEKKLFNPAAGKASSLFSKLLADDFVEFGSSGRIYSRKQIIESLLHETATKISTSNFKAVRLDKEYFLVTYKALKTIDKTKIYSLRSSIWRFRDNKWQIVFHQGTLTNENK